MTAERLTAAEINARLGAKVRPLCERLGLRVRQVGPELWGLPTSEGGPGDSFSIRWAGQKAGVWHHRSAAQGGDALGLVKWVLNVEIAPAIQWAKDFLGIEPGRDLPPLPERAPIAADSPAEAERRRALALSIWRFTKPLEGTPAEAYLRSRGIVGALPPSLRFHPSVRHTGTKSTAFPKGRAFPALVARVEDAAGGFLGVWRIYLEPDGRKLQGVDLVKIGLGAVRGGSVPLTPSLPWASKILVTEGIETGLAVRQQWPATAVRAALSTSGMIGLAVPEGVEEIVYCADRDAPDTRETLETVIPSTGEVVARSNPMFGRRPGEEAAKRAAAVAKARGLRTATIRPPDDGTDFLDVFGKVE
jgi:hypothetical protein